MKDAGHRACVEAALKFEKTDRTPVNNFAVVTSARSAGVKVDEARWNPKLSAKVAIDYAMKTESDFVKPILDSQVPFKDMGMEVRFPEDDYGMIPGHVVETAEDIDKLAIFDPYAADECPGFTKRSRRSRRRPRRSPRTCTYAAFHGARSPPPDTPWARRT